MGTVYPDPPDLASTPMPFKRTVGHEVEYCSGSELVYALYEAGLTQDRSFHDYHCRDCQADNYAIHSTEDGTAYGGEYLIGGHQGVVFGSDTYMDVIEKFSDHAIEVRCGVDNEVGMHTHVGIADLSDLQKRLLVRNYLALQDQFLELAAMGMNGVRSNGCTDPRLNTSYYIRNDADWDIEPVSLAFQLPGRPTLNFSRHTVEFRVWNSTKSMWRMFLAGGISTALVEATADGHVAGRPGEVHILEFLGNYLTPELIVLAERQFAYQKGLR